MTNYEKNIEALSSARPFIYDKLKNYKKIEDNILCGDALDGEKFLAMNEKEKVIPLNSIYHPTHEAERYVKQFEELSTETILFLYGFSNGLVCRKVLENTCPIKLCIAYEPSVEIFLKVLEVYDIADLLRNTDLLIFIKGINDEELEKTLYDVMDYRNWKLFRFSIASCYDKLFEEDCHRILKMYSNVVENKHMEMNTLVQYAQSGMQNEIKALKWLMDCRILEQYKGKFPADMPCIIVAAGPSLEKNADVLRQAKGKALIICVDTALPFLLNKDIIPDLACTIDAQKGEKYFTDPRLQDIPILVSTDSDYHALERIGTVKPIYIAAMNDFYQRLFKEKGWNVNYFDGGGSVATVSFQVAIELGFQTVILIGQDLAFSDDKAHAGMGIVNNEDLDSKLLMVEGYYGGKILSRVDFKHYIDWYNLRIPELTDRKIINATEGGAKLHGAIQMTLQEVVDQYCNKSYPVTKMIEEEPCVWETIEEKEALYREIEKMYCEFKKMKKAAEQGIADTERAIVLLKRKNYLKKDLERIDKDLDRVIEMVNAKEGAILIVRRMIYTEVTLADDLHKTESDLELESIRLYGKMKKYLTDIKEALQELLPFWKNVQNEISNAYGFETRK